MGAWGPCVEACARELFGPLASLQVCWPMMQSGWGLHMSLCAPAFEPCKPSPECFLHVLPGLDSTGDTVVTTQALGLPLLAHSPEGETEWAGLDGGAQRWALDSA